MQGRAVRLSKVLKTELVLPPNTNSLGSVFGGTIMSWIDIAAAICAQRHCQSEVVTASIDALNFVAPVYVGWVVNLYASVNYTGQTSMEIGVRVDGENPRTGVHHHTASAYLTFVSIDKDGHPKTVPPVVPETDEEKRRYRDASARRQQRLDLRKSLAR